MLRHDVEHILDRADYEYSGYAGCFDIVARREKEILLLKVLDNVDSIQKEQAENMKVLSHALDAAPAIVGLWTRREKLYDDIVYDRFDIPAFTPKTLQNALNGSWPMIYRFRGGFFSQINPEQLREKRNGAGLTQSELADQADVTKKNIYEHEAGRKFARKETVERIEKMLGKVSEHINFWDSRAAAGKAEPRGQFEKAVSGNLRRIGFETSFVYQTPFNIIASERKFLVLSDAEENERKAEKNEKYLTSFSDVVGKPVLVITRKKLDIALPSDQERDIKNMTKKDLIRTVKGW
jgi:putative transcriptional regulator